MYSLKQPCHSLSYIGLWPSCLIKLIIHVPTYCLCFYVTTTHPSQHIVICVFKPYLSILTVFCTQRNCIKMMQIFRGKGVGARGWVVVFQKSIFVRFSMSHFTYKYLSNLCQVLVSLDLHLIGIFVLMFSYSYHILHLIFGFSGYQYYNYFCEVNFIRNILLLILLTWCNCG